MSGKRCPLHQMIPLKKSSERRAGEGKAASRGTRAERDLFNAAQLISRQNDPRRAHPLSVGVEISQLNNYLLPSLPSVPALCVNAR